jgi:hypothetical protein
MQSISSIKATEAASISLSGGTHAGPLERALTAPPDSSPEAVFIHVVRQLVFARAVICGVLALAMVMVALRFGAAAERLTYFGTGDTNQSRRSPLVSGNTGGVPFSIRGFVGFGATKLTTWGEADNLSSPAPFAVTYSQSRTGLALRDTGNGRL